MQLTARDVCKKPIKLEPTNSLNDARNAMMRHNISRIVVSKDSRPVGIVTEKSISRFMYRDTIGRPLDKIRLDQVIKRDPITTAGETDLKRCAQIMLDKEISSIIVVDSKGKLEGIFTKSDLANVYAKHYGGRNSVKDYMTKKVLSVFPTHSIHTVLSILIKNRVSRVVVVRDQKPIGIITARDILPTSIFTEVDAQDTVRQGSKSQRRTEAPLLSGLSHVLLARDVMKQDPLTVTRHLDLASAAQIMINNKISGLPVVDSDNKLVGIVTKTDVVRALAVE